MTHPRNDDLTPVEDLARARAVAGRAASMSEQLKGAGVDDPALLEALDQLWTDAGAHYNAVLPLVAAMEQINPQVFAQKRRLYQRLVAAKQRRLDVPQRDVSQPPAGSTVQPGPKTVTADEALARATPKAEAEIYTARPGWGLPSPRRRRQQ